MACARRAARRALHGLCAGVLMLGPPGRSSAHESAAGLPSQIAAAALPCDCGADRLAPLRAYRDQLGAQGSAERARSLALASAAQARRALDRARRIAIWDRAAFADGYERLAALQERIARAPSAAAVAAELDALLPQGRAALGEHAARAQLDASDGCSYSTGEIIAIVLGLILGIIPGLILLVLLC